MKFAYSFSRLNIFDKCPKAFEFKYIQKLQEPQSPALMIGSKFHEIAAEYNKFLADHNLETNLNYFQKLIQEKADLPDDMNDDLMAVLNAYIDYYSLEKNLSYWNIEENFAFNSNWNKVDWLANDVFFRAKMDLMFITTKILVIRDWKTDRWLPSESIIKKSFQLELYALVASKLFPNTDSFIIQLDYVRHQVRRSRIIEREELIDIEKKLMKKVERIEKTKEFKPRLSSYCEWCGFKSICPIYKQYLKKLNIETIDTNIKAQETAEKIWAAEQFIKEAKNKLKIWIFQNKPIEVGDLLLDFHKSEKTKIIDIEHAIIAMIAAGVQKDKIWNKLTLSQTAIKSLLKKKKELIQSILDNYAIKQVSTNFKFQKIKE